MSLIKIAQNLFASTLGVVFTSDLFNIELPFEAKLILPLIGAAVGPMLKDFFAVFLKDFNSYIRIKIFKLPNNAKSIDKEKK